MAEDKEVQEEFDSPDTIYPYFKIKLEDGTDCYEGKFWNNCNKHIAIVARVNPGVDWSAYIGTDAPFSMKVGDTLIDVAKYGEKLTPEFAKFVFPRIHLPYRH